MKACHQRTVIGTSAQAAKETGKEIKGLQTMEVLGQNMAFLLNRLHA